MGSRTPNLTLGFHLIQPLKGHKGVQILLCNSWGNMQMVEVDIIACRGTRQDAKGRVSPPGIPSLAILIEMLIRLDRAKGRLLAAVAQVDLGVCDRIACFT